jgi:hypothetical protein
MARAQFEIVIETVRYAPDGKIELVRAFERRGAAFSDHVLIPRAALVEKIKSGKKCFTGKRKENLGGMFTLEKQVQLVGEHLTTAASAERDYLENVPIF